MRKANPVAFGMRTDADESPRTKNSYGIRSASRRLAMSLSAIFAALCKPLPLSSDQSEIRSALHLIMAGHDGRQLAVRFDSISRVTKDAAVDDDAIAAEFRAYRERSAQLPLTSRLASSMAAAQIRFADKVARLANVKPI